MTNNDKTTEQPKTEEPKKEDTQPTEEFKKKTQSVEESKKPEAPKKPEASKKSKKTKEPKVSKEVKISAKLSNIIKDIEKLTVLELADLVKALEDKFGVSGVPVAAAPATARAQSDQAAGPSLEQTIFNVVLAQTGANKIQVIKALRKIKPTLGLQDAKKMSESAPEEVLNQVNKKEAEEAKKKLEAAGATVELK